MLNFPDAPTADQEFVTPKVTFAWTGATRWRRKNGTPPPVDVLPTLTALVPAQGEIGSPNLTVRVQGTEFTATTVVVWDGAVVTSTYVSATEMTTVVPLTGAARTVQVAARNGTLTSNQLPFEYLPQPPLALIMLDPSSGVVNATHAVDIIGTGFTATTKVLWQAAFIPATFVDSSTLRVTAPSHPTAEAQYVYLTEDEVNWTQPPVPFTYTAVPLVLTSLNPGAAILDPINGIDVEMHGSGFNSNCWAIWNGWMQVVSYVSPTKLIATGVERKVLGTFPVLVRDQTTMAESNALDFMVTSNQPPQLLSVSPNSAVQGNTIATLTVTGQNFVNGKRIKLDGVAVATTYVNATTLTTTNVVAPFSAPSIKVTVEDCPGEVNVTLTSTSFQITGGPTWSYWPYPPQSHPYVGDCRFWLNRNVGDNNQCKVVLTHQDTGERFVFGTYADFQGDPTSSWFSPTYVKPVPPNQWFWLTVEIGGVPSANREGFSLVS